MSGQRSTRMIHSEAYGTFEIEESQIYHFPRGIIGLSEYQDYALVQIEDAPYYILHALEHELSFILLPASNVTEDYGFQIDQATIDLLEINKPEDVMTFLIVNIVEEIPCVNLRAPVLLTLTTQKGCQFIIDNSDYSVRHALSRKGDG